MRALPLAAFALLLPTALRAQEVVVAARDLPRGAVLRADDLRPAPPALQSAAVPADTPSVGPGWVTHRVIRAGEPLRPPAVTPPPAVTRGSVVTVRWRAQGLEIARTGIAMGDAGRGERVTVRLDATRRVTGRVTAPGEVEAQ